MRRLRPRIARVSSLPRTTRITLLPRTPRTARITLLPRTPRTTRITLLPRTTPTTRTTRTTRIPALVFLIGVVLLFAAACSEPPQKEIDQAQAALDAARAAGAETYAAEEYTAAVAALKNAHDAVDQRDYRQALTYAIDARQRAADAGRQAEGGKTRARRAAEALVTECSARISQLGTDIKVATNVRVPPSDLRPAQATLASAGSALQEARSSIQGGNYQDVVPRLAEVRKNLDIAIASVDALRHHPPRRRRS